MAKPTRYTPEIFEEYEKKGYWQSVTFSDLWKRNAEAYPDKEAIVDLKTRLTWAQSNLWIDRLALKLTDLGIKKDGMVAVQLPNCVELCLIRIACERAGLLCAPLLRNFRHNEMEYILKYVEAGAIVIAPEFRGFNYLQMIQQIRPKVPSLKHIILIGESTRDKAISFKDIINEPIEKRYPLDYLEKARCPANEFSLVIPTSGSTGFPKLVEHPICSRMYMGRAYVEKFGLVHNDIIGVLSPAPGGPNTVAYFGAPLLGATVVMEERFEPEEALKLIEKEKITFVGIVPTQIFMMATHPRFHEYDLTSLRMIWTGAAPLNYDLAKEAEEKFHCPIVQGYGLVDAGGVTVNSPNDPQEARLCTVGKPMPGNEVQLMHNGKKSGSEGEIQAKGPTFVSGYYKDPEATRELWSEDGWYDTGDLGKFDNQGNLIIIGRKKDTIKRGGQNIYPLEIENILLTHPKISGAAIVGMPDAFFGERACAYIVVRPGETFAFDEMVSFLKNKNIAPYKLPERMEIVDSLPMVGGGQKVDKKSLALDIIRKLNEEKGRRLR